MMRTLAVVLQMHDRATLREKLLSVSFYLNEYKYGTYSVQLANNVCVSMCMCVCICVVDYSEYRVMLNIGLSTQNAWCNGSVNSNVANTGI